MEETKNDASNREEPVLPVVEQVGGVSSLLSAGEINCDKCGKIIRHLGRYYYSARECPVCGVRANKIAERETHFSQAHSNEPSRGARYCGECAQKAELLKKESERVPG